MGHLALIRGLRKQEDLCVTQLGKALAVTQSDDRSVSTSVTDEWTYKISICSKSLIY